MTSESESRLVVSDSLRPHGHSPWDSPGQNTGVGSLSLLQGIFPTQGSNPGVPHCRWILYQLSHKKSPRILEWVGYLFCNGSSWPRNWTGVSCIAGRFVTNWAVREAESKEVTHEEDLLIGLAEVLNDHQRAAKTLVGDSRDPFGVLLEPSLKDGDAQEKWKKGLVYHLGSIP